VVAMRPEDAIAMSPWRLPAIGLDNLTPASRAALANTLFAVCGAALVPSLFAPGLLYGLVPIAAILPVALAAWRTARDAREHFYLNPSPGALRLEEWDVVPGVRAGPFELGPPGSELLDKLRLAHACWYVPGAFAYVIRTGPAWVAACFTADCQAPPQDSFPELASLKELVWVETSWISHQTPEGVCPGMEVAEVTRRLGPPWAVSRTSRGVVRMEYRGLTVHVWRERVLSLRVVPTDPYEALKPWQTAT